jgi:hypothetical protein
MAGRSTGLFSRALGLAAAAALLLAAPAAAGTLDQQQTSSSTDAGLFTFQSVAQTFRPGITGGLDQVDLSLLKAGTPPPTVTVEIRDAPAGSPGTGVLATATISTSTLSAAPAFVVGTFATPAPVTAGTQYAIVVYSPGSGGNSVGLRYQSATNPYPSGSMFTSSTPLPPGPPWAEFATSDVAFKTYVRTATCKGRPATYVGTPGVDVIAGSAGDDVIAALEGNDDVSGLAGNDLICGGAGKDKLRGGPGKDKLFGEAGKDKLTGGGAKDVCKGGGGNDSGKCEVAKSL